MLLTPQKNHSMSNKTQEQFLKDYAKLLYTRHDESFKNIAVITQTDEATLRNWATEEYWAQHKRTLLTSRQAVLENLYDTLEELSAKMKSGKDNSAKDMDLYLKYTTAIKNLEGETTMAEIVETGILFTTWLRRKNFELSKTFTRYWDEFIKSRMNPCEE
jgi:hypothetical protein